MTTEHCTEPGCTGSYDDGYCDVCGSPQDTGVAAQAESARTHSTRTGSARLASAALGSSRTSSTGTGATRRVGTSSTRLRGHRIGAGLTTVPPTPTADPLQAVMAVPEVPERKRYCPACNSAVGRARGDEPGRTEGFCPTCGNRFNFTPQLEPGDLVGGQYKVVGCIAHGGLGWIYLARDENLDGRWVVLKGLLNSGDPDAYAAAVSERKFLAEVAHPLIVEIYNFAKFEGAGYIVMSYVGGTSLKDILAGRREANHNVNLPLPVDQALAYILEILPAFSYLHDNGLLFCDFKPDNVIQEGDGLKLIDLGGVRRIDDLDSAIFGTVGFQAPEVAEVGPSVASDIYTIGRTLAVLTLDFRGNTTTYVDSLPPVSDTPLFSQYESFYRLLAKACAANPSDRFGTIDEMRAQVLGVLREVVALDRTSDTSAPHSVASVLFEAPQADQPDRPLAWNELPALLVDPSDPAAAWLTGVNITDPDRRLAALRGAPQETVEVLLLRARTAIEAGNHELVSDTVAQVLTNDPWEWRAAWISGLDQLSRGAFADARASFNAVYGQVPGELAPKLALATACEQSDEPGIAEDLYSICSRCDANYTAPAAFGLARIRSAAGDVDAALSALDLVTSTRRSYVDARLERAQLLARSGRGLPALAGALDSIESVPVEPSQRARLRVGVLAAALAAITDDGPNPAITIGGATAEEAPMRDALESAYHDQAAVEPDHDTRIGLVDQANTVRNWSLW